MSRKQKHGMLALAAIALAATYWTGYVHGSNPLAPHEIIISVALPMILIWTLAKLAFAFLFRRGSVPPPGGSQPPLGPSAGVPAPTPPGAPPQIYCEHSACSY